MLNSVERFFLRVNEVKSGNLSIREANLTTLAKEALELVKTEIKICSAGIKNNEIQKRNILKDAELTKINIEKNLRILGLSA